LREDCDSEGFCSPSGTIARGESDCRVARCGRRSADDSTCGIDCQPAWQARGAECPREIGGPYFISECNALPCRRSGRAGDDWQSRRHSDLKRLAASASRVGGTHRRIVDTIDACRRTSDPATRRIQSKACRQPRDSILRRAIARRDLIGKRSARLRVRTRRTAYYRSLSLGCEYRED
jgi:hypothetical protein